MWKKFICGLLFAGYTALIYWATVFSREAYSQAGSDWRLFWTYGAIADGRNELIGEVISNVLMFVPLGLLLGLLVKHKVWLHVLVPGVVLSLGIELLQLKLKRGLCETDDIIHSNQ